MKLGQEPGEPQQADVHGVQLLPPHGALAQAGVWGMRSLPGHNLVSALAFGFGLGCAEGMGVQGTATALQPSCLWALSLLQVQPREEKMLISSQPDVFRCLKHFSLALSVV